jgi:hypothetical protein
MGILDEEFKISMDNINQKRKELGVGETKADIFLESQLLWKEQIKLAYHKKSWNFSIVSKDQLKYEYIE